MVKLFLGRTLDVVKSRGHTMIKNRLLHNKSYYIKDNPNVIQHMIESSKYPYSMDFVVVWSYIMDYKNDDYSRELEEVYNKYQIENIYVDNYIPFPKGDIKCVPVLIPDEDIIGKTKTDLTSDGTGFVMKIQQADFGRYYD